MPTEQSKYTRHTASERDRLIGAIEAHKSVSKGAAQENIPVWTARDIYNKYKETGSTEDLARTGRPQVITERTARHVVREARKNRRKPLADIGKSVVPQISGGSVQRVLNSAGYHRRVARKVPYLRIEQKKARMQWARVNRKLSEKDWEDITWSDESYIYIGDTHGRVYVTRRVDEVLHEDCVVPTFKQSSLRVMVWGCIMRGRKGPLVVLEYPGGKGGGMNSKRYQEQVLEAVLKDFYAKEKERKPNIRFQQDGAPSHSSKSTKKWLLSHHIKTFYHPSSSPDLTPIEPVWHELKTIIRARPHPPTSIEELKAAVLEAWDALSLDDIDKYIRRMPDRVEAVLAAKGGHTRF